MIKGLSYFIRTLSLEYTPERIGPVIHSIAYLATLRNYEHSYSIAESMVLARADFGKADTPVSTGGHRPEGGPLTPFTRD